MNRTRYRLAVTPGVLLLCGCSGLFHSSERPEQTYYLSAPAPAAQPVPHPAAAGSGAILRVSRPLAGPGLDSTRIVLLQADHRMDFFAGSRWPAPLPDVLESLAVQTVRSSGRWSVVTGSNSHLSGEYLLQISVRRFEADYTAGAAPQVQVALDCILARSDAQQDPVAFVATGTAQAAANRMSEVLAAFQEASSQALTSLSRQAAELPAQH